MSFYFPHFPKILFFNYTLGNTHTLYLRLCDKITDISALENTHALYLINCNRITDVSVLTKFIL